MKNEKSIDDILMNVERGWDYIHNYLESETQMLKYDPEWDFDSEWSEDLFDYLAENNTHYMFKVFQDIFYKGPISLVDNQDEQVFEASIPYIKHKLWYDSTIWAKNKLK